MKMASLVADWLDSIIEDKTKAIKSRNLEELKDQEGDEGSAKELGQEGSFQE